MHRYGIFHNGRMLWFGPHADPAAALDEFQARYGFRPRSISGFERLH